MYYKRCKFAIDRLFLQIKDRVLLREVICQAIPENDVFAIKSFFYSGLQGVLIVAFSSANINTSTRRSTKYRT